MIVVTAATGELGRLVVEELLARVPAERIALAVRTPEKAAGFAARGVAVREADYDRPDTLRTAFQGADRLLLISSNEFGKRVAQHSAAVDAAKDAGVSLLAYTSLVRANVSPLQVAADHKVTEEYIRASGLTYVFLRNGPYTDMWTASARQGVEYGKILGSARDGKFASASRADLATAAAVVLTGDGHENTTYELSGDTTWTLAELAGEITSLSGKQVAYQDLPEEEYARILTGFGLPEVAARIVADIDAQAPDGWLGDTTGDLAKLIGRPSTPMRETLAAALSD